MALCNGDNQAPKAVLACHSLPLPLSPPPPGPCQTPVPRPSPAPAVGPGLGPVPDPASDPDPDPRLTLTLTLTLTRPRPWPWPSPGPGPGPDPIPGPELGPGPGLGWSYSGDRSQIPRRGCFSTAHWRARCSSPLPRSTRPCRVSTGGGCPPWKLASRPKAPQPQTARVHQSCPPRPPRLNCTWERCGHGVHVLTRHTAAHNTGMKQEEIVNLGLRELVLNAFIDYEQQETS